MPFPLKDTDCSFITHFSIIIPNQWIVFCARSDWLLRFRIVSVIHIPATHPGNPSRQPIPATHPGNPSRQPIPTTHPGNPSRQPIPATHPGNPSRQPIPATHPGNPSRQPIPALLLISRGRALFWAGYPLVWYTPNSN